MERKDLVLNSDSPDKGARCFHTNKIGNSVSAACSHNHYRLWSRGFASPVCAGFAFIEKEKYFVCILEQIIECAFCSPQINYSIFDYSFDNHSLVLFGDLKWKILR